METIKEQTLESHQYLINPKLVDFTAADLNKANVLVSSRQNGKIAKDSKEKEMKNTEEHLYQRMCMDLPLYQDKIKRDKILYKEEFMKFLNVFIPKFNAFLESPTNNHGNIKDVFVFLAHLSHIFTKELAFLPAQLKELLEHSHAIIPSEVRIAIIDCFKLLRKKNLIEPVDILPLFFQILTCQDKELRQKLQEIIVTDLQRINEKAKNHKVNKFIRNKCSEMLLNPNYKAARKTLNIMILLYKKRVWNDEKTVNAIAQACYNNDAKIAYAASKFFLSEYEEIDEESENEDMDDLKKKYKLLGKGNNKKTKKRKEKIKTLMKAVERRDNRKSKVKVNKDFMPIDLINDPSTLCERMFDKIKNVKVRKHYKLKISLLRLIGRICGRHKISVPNFFSLCATLVRPRQDDLTSVLASIIEATHHMTSATDLEPVVNELFDYFICESFPAQYITVGVNALIGLVERLHNVLKYDQYTAVEDLKKVKNKSVSTAVRAFINMVRDVNPDLMENKAFDSNYNHVSVGDGIEGIDLLKMHEGLPEDYKIECNELLTDKQLKKLRLLKMKDNAEAIQRIRLNLSKSDVNEMLGEKRDKEQDKKDKKDKLDKKEIKAITKDKVKKKASNNELTLKENEKLEEIDDDVDEDCEEEGDEDGSDLSDTSILDDMEDAESYYSEEDEEGEEIDDDEGEEIEDDEDEGEEIDDDEEEEEEELDDKEQAKQELDLLLDQDSKDEDDESEVDDDEDNNEFVNEDQLNTYKRTFRERRDLLKSEDKEEFKLKRKKKSKGQKTNLEARKNKPLPMVIHKINRKKLRENDKNLSFRIKNMKKQLGRFKRGNMVLNKKGQGKNKEKKKTKKFQ